MRQFIAGDQDYNKLLCSKTPKSNEKKTQEKQKKDSTLSKNKTKLSDCDTYDKEQGLERWFDEGGH